MATAYKNWDADKPIPKYCMVYNGEWVIPEELEMFMPPDEILNDLCPGMDVVYMHSGTGYSLFDGKYVDA